MDVKISEQDAQFALDIVKKICAEVGPGLPGTPQEKQRGLIIKDELVSHLGAENVDVEDFTLAPGAIFGTQPILAVFIFLAAILNISVGHITGISPWIAAIAALVFSILQFVIYILEVHLGFEFIDRFFKKKQSINVIGSLRKPGAQQIKRLIILSGHHDSQYEFTWLRLFGKAYILPYLTMFIGMVAVLAASSIQLIGLIANNVDIVRFGTLHWGLLVYPVLPSIVVFLTFTGGRKNGGVVPGAADNLSASASAVAMCRFLVNNPAYIPDGTEIRYISFGSEEVGVRGARRYVARHLDELKRLDARQLNYETIAHSEIAIITSDLNGTLKYSPEMVKSLIEAASRAGVPYRVSSGFIGLGSDAAPFSKVGLKSATLLPFKVPEQMVAFYHQRTDTPEILSIEPLLNVLKLTLEWVRNNGD